MNATIYKGTSGGQRRPSTAPTPEPETPAAALAATPPTPPPRGPRVTFASPADDGPRPRPAEGEVGGTGVSFFGGYIQNDEWNPSLTGTTGADTYNKMRREAQVQSTVRFVTLPVRGAKWRFEAGEPQSEGTVKSDPKVEAFLNEALKRRLNHRMGGFDGLMAHLLLAVPFGYEVLEKVYDTSDGKNVWLKKLGHRAQSTIQRWLVNADGDLEGIEQNIYKGTTWKTVKVPEVPSVEEAAAKLVHIAVDQEGNNFEGISMLRAAYGPWFFKEQALRIGAIGVERFGAGLPVAKEPEDTTPGARTAMDTLLKNLRTGASSFMRLPFGWEVGMFGESATGARVDPVAFIRYCDEMIAMNVLAMGLKLGSTETGSRALGDSMFGVFMLLLQALANLIATVITEQIARPLVEMNFPGAKGIAIQTKWSNLTMTDPSKLAEYLASLTTVGVVTADDELENYVRSAVELPALPEGGIPRDRSGRVVINPTAAQTAVAYAFPRRLRADHRHGHDHVHLADTGDWWRPLRPAEKHIALNEIAGRENDAAEEVVDIAQKAKSDWAAALGEQIAAALSAGDVEALSGIDVPEDLLAAMEEDLLDVLDDTLDFGRRTVHDERKRQIRAARLELDPDSPRAVALRAREGRASSIRLRDVPLDDAELIKIQTVAVREYLGRLSGRVRSLAIERARAIYRTVGDAITEPQIREIIQDVETFLEQAARNEARPLVAESVSLGRDAGAQELADEIRHAEYSAILDESVCANCARDDEDARVVELSSEEYFRLMPPNRECLSAAGPVNRCRCLWVYVFETDT